MTQIPEPLLKIGYNLLFTAGFALTWPYFTYLIWRRQPFWERLGERLGHYPKEVKEWLKRPDRPVWIHAVSVGEVLLARVLVRELRRHRPNLRVFLTVGTPTGRRVAEPLLDDKTCLVYVPTDFYYSMMRAFRRVNPRALILVENEIWPNMLWRAKKMGIPVCLVNSRLSRRNRRLFRAARTFVRPVLQAFDWIGVQSEEDLGRFAIAGFPENRLHLMGSMKYDVADLASDNPGKGREVALLGAMAELGSFSRMLHEESGAMVARSQTALCFAIGADSKFLVEAAKKTRQGDWARWFASRDELLAAYRREAQPDDRILVKGSRFQQMDLVAAELRKVS